MLILFDHVTTQGIVRALVGHTVVRARERAIEAARYLEQRNSGAVISAADLRDGSVVAHAKP